MTHPAPVIAPSAAVTRTRPSTRSTLKLLSLVAALAAPQALHADTVAKACGKKWVARAMRLDPQQIAWLLEERNAEMSADLDGDGRPDSLRLASHANFRSCEVKKVWAEKESSLRIEYATGRSKLFHWFGAGLVEQLKIYPELGRILVVGVDERGNQASKWLRYRTPVATPGAEAPAIPAEPPAAGALVASLR